MPAPSNTLLPSSTLYPSEILVPGGGVFIPPAGGVDTGLWEFVVCDKAGGAIGDPVATVRQYNPGISTTETASFQVRVGSPLWDQIAAGDMTLKVYDSTKTLRYYGDIITDELSGSGQGGMVQVNSADLSFRLGQRYVGKDPDGVGLEYVNEDARAIAFDLLNRVNDEQDTGISIGEGFVALSGGGGGGPTYGDPGIFGKNTVGSTYSLVDAGGRYGSPFDLTEDASIQKLTADISAEFGGPPSQTLTGEVHTGSVTGPLIATSSSAVIGHNQARSWVDFTFTPFTEPPGTYYLVILGGATTQGSRFYHTGGVYSIYASYVTVAPPADPTPPVFVGPTVTYTWKKMLDALSELGSLADSFEWQLRYRDGAPPTVYLDLLPELGTDKSDEVFFEYGTGLNNCQSFRRTRTVQSKATRVYALGSGSTLTSEAFDTAAESSVYSRAEDVLSVGEITDPTLLDALATLHVAIRKNARVTVTMTPFPKTAPKYGRDWVKGDYVTARVKVNDTAVVNGKARAWGASITISDEGEESSVPTLEPT